MRKLLIIAMICAVYTLTFPFRAYAAEGEPSATPAPVTTPMPVTTYTPFTPSGMGTVIDAATDKDGKEFYTIMTPEENVFYLVIDRQRGTENVYFLNAVTEADLLALVELPEAAEPTPAVSPAPSGKQPQANAAPQGEPGDTPEAEPEQSGGVNMGTLILVGAVVLVGGGAGWYFKIYKPKQERAVSEEDADYSEDEADPYGGTGQEDSPAWYGAADEDSGDGEE